MKRQRSSSEIVENMGDKQKKIKTTDNNKSPQMPSPRTRSLYVDYFQISYVNNIKYGFCLKCGKNEKGEFKVGFKMTGHNTKSLRTHLQKIHSDIYKELSDTPVSSKNKTDPIRKTKLQEFFHKNDFGALDDKRKNVLFIAGNNLPMNFFDKPLNKAYLRNPPKTLPHRQKLREDVIDEYQQMQKKLIQCLQENSSRINFTFDGWSSRNLNHYYGLTGHFIDKNWKLISIALDLIPANKNFSG